MIIRTAIHYTTSIVPSVGIASNTRDAQVSCSMVQKLASLIFVPSVGIEPTSTA